MQYLTKSEIIQGKGFASHDLRNEIAAMPDLQNDSLILNCAYTDYGGAPFDIVIIRYFEANYPENIRIESTSYSGENALIFGDIVKEFQAVNEDYPLAFKNLEDFYYEMLNNIEVKSFKYFLRELRIYNNYRIKRTALNFLIANKGGYYPVTTQGVDFSYDEAEKYLLENNQIIRKEVVK